MKSALQTAVALASYDAEIEAEAIGEKQGWILVRDENFQAVVDRRRDFINYRKSIMNQDEDASAHIRREVEGRLRSIELDFDEL
jgi:hypothetical protein